MALQMTYDDVAKVFPEIAEIKDDHLRNAVGEIWREMAAEMAWDSLDEIPKNTKGEKNRCLVEHIRGVTQMAMRICETALELSGRTYDRDTIVAAGLLHDVSKLVEYEPDPAQTRGNTGPRPGRQSKLGKNVQHGVYAAHKMFAKGLSLELVNLIVTHTHGSNMRGKTWETAALFYADFADTDAGLSMAGAKLYSERWSLGHE